MIAILSITLRTLNYGNCGIFFIMGSAGFISYSIEPTIWSLEFWKCRRDGGYFESGSFWGVTAGVDQVSAKRVGGARGEIFKAAEIRV